MKVAVLGRTQALIEASGALRRAGHEVVLVATGKPAAEDPCGVANFQDLAREIGAEFLERVDLTKLNQTLSNLQPDIGISVNYPVILPAEIVELPRRGILNAHGGDLPRYRGNACQAWAILQGEDRVALCIHRMVGGEVDSGDILARRYLQINDATQIGQILQWMNMVIPDCFVEAVAALESDSNFCLEKQSVDPSHSLRCFPRRPEDGRIDWSTTATQVVRLINASGAPFAGAFAMYEGRRVTVEVAEEAKGLSPYLAVPGQVIERDLSHITVACGTGAVRIMSAWCEDDRIPLVEAVRSVRARLS